MSILSHTGLELLYEQIKLENPTLPSNLTAANSILADGVALESGRYRATLLGKYTKGWRGQLEIEYNRLALDRLIPPNSVVRVKTPGALSTRFDDVERSLGLVLSLNDVKEVAAGATLPYQVTIEAQPNSAVFTGSVVVTFVERGDFLDTAILNDDYVVTIPKTTLVANSLDFITHAHDYTAIASTVWFKPNPWVTGNTLVNEARTTRLRDALKTVDGLTWGLTTGNYPLIGAVVEYHGPSDGYSVYGTGARTSLERLLVLTLVNGAKAFIYYNFWVDPAIAAAFPGNWES